MLRCHKHQIAASATVVIAMLFARLRSPLPAILRLGIVVSFAATDMSYAQRDFEREPISYSTTRPSDRVGRLKSDIDSGHLTLKRDEAHGFLRSLLKELDVPVSSQVLVFSKTSLQRRHISRRTPRALYFDDDVYIGWVPNGDIIEISSTDPRLGTVFYTLSQNPDNGKPKLTRETSRCMLCHASTHTGRVPGHILRSIVVDSSSKPLPASRSYRTDHSSPLHERWGGWYVTGTHGKQSHMGNRVFTALRRSESSHTTGGDNRTTLGDDFDTTPYLSPHSDIVALMVLAHQVTVHNEITKAAFSVRRASHNYSEGKNRQTSTPHDEALRRKIETAAKGLVEGLLLTREAELTSAIDGTTLFSKEFQHKGPSDETGRSLRQLDLKHRLFRYPCSFLIYTEAFDALPAQLLDAVYLRLWHVLSGEDESREFQHLSHKDRQAVLQILRETKPTLPDYWHPNRPKKECRTAETRKSLLELQPGCVKPEEVAPLSSDH